MYEDLCHKDVVVKLLLELCVYFVVAGYISYYCGHLQKAKLH